VNLPPCQADFEFQKQIENTLDLPDFAQMTGYAGSSGRRLERNPA
jgi:hypothetical protein